MSDPIEFVTEFLLLVEDRDLDKAAEYLSDEVEITFPGGRIFTDLHQQVESSRGRFQTASKVFDRFDVVSDGDGVVVYVYGTLEGKSLGGEPFSGVRFIDRFVLRDGRIVDQKVWNDLAESGALSEI